MKHVDSYSLFDVKPAKDFMDSVKSGFTAELPTNQRFERSRFVVDPSLSALTAQLGRYLLIASSRPGAQAGNLSGIWNYRVLPSWASNYTISQSAQLLDLFGGK
jgi:hypothetical protein